MDTYQRNRRFIYSDYLALFSDEVVPKGGDKTPSEAKEEKTDFLV